MKWKRLKKEEIMKIGMKIRIADLQHMINGGITPQFSAGCNGIILRLNRKTVTVDIFDGKPIRCAYKDIGIMSNL